MIQLQAFDYSRLAWLVGYVVLIALILLIFIIFFFHKTFYNSARISILVIGHLLSHRLLSFHWAC